MSISINLKKIIFEEKNTFFEEHVILKLQEVINNLNSFVLETMPDSILLITLDFKREFTLDESKELAENIFFNLEPHQIALRTESKTFDRITANKNYEKPKQIEDLFLLNANKEFVYPVLEFVKLDEEGINYNLILTIYKLFDFGSYIRFGLKTKKYVSINMTNPEDISTMFKHLSDTIIG